ncbi:MAG: DUF1329 domain-containing protein [Proteobacteria bacterium]|nr:DUF1329 domain-containing protein [Pseudomonadota bacterium]
MKGKRNSVSAGLLVLIILAFSFPMQSRAGDVTFPTPGYNDQELAKVREWEKTWVGKKVTTETIDQVKDFLSESVYKAMKNPKAMGADSLWFEIVPYRPYENSKGVIEATKKYAPNSKLDDKEGLINFGNVAGYPFPQPKSGVEMAWNFDGNTRGDTHFVDNLGEVVDCKTKLERHAEHLRWDTYWAGRTDLQPLPKIADAQNPRGIFRSFFQRHLAPVDFVDTTMLEIRYLDMNREEDLWVYTAMFRRIRRYATSQRTDTIDGTDMIYDDQDGWYTPINLNSYKFLGRADLLVGRHQDKTKVQRATGQGFWNGVQRERVNNWVVEVVNKDKDYIYSKQIWYLDPETWQMNFKIMYNRQGELWKTYEMFYNEYPTALGQKAAYMAAEHTVDFIRHHGSPSQYVIKGISVDIPLTQYQTSALKEKAY